WSKAVNRSCFLSRATRRTPPNPWDTRSPLCVGRVLASTVFSLIDALPSTPSAEAQASLFGSFMGTMASCDSSGACMSGLWLFAFPDRSPFIEDAPEVSRFSCILFRGVPGVFDYAGSGVGSRDNADRRCGLPTDRTGSAPGSPFSQLHTLPTGASVYASPAASRRPVQDSRSGWNRFSFPVGLFHPLQYAGLSRRSLSPGSSTSTPMIQDLFRLHNEAKFTTICKRKI